MTDTIEPQPRRLTGGDLTFPVLCLRADYISVIGKFAELSLARGRALSHFFPGLELVDVSGRTYLVARAKPRTPSVLAKVVNAILDRRFLVDIFVTEASQYTSAAQLAERVLPIMRLDSYWSCLDPRAVGFITEAVKNSTEIAQLINTIGSASSGGEVLDVS
jgi:hypothetical protein